MIIEGKEMVYKLRGTEFRCGVDVTMNLYRWKMEDCRFMVFAKGQKEIQ